MSSCHEIICVSNVTAFELCEGYAAGVSIEEPIRFRSIRLRVRAIELQLGAAVHLCSTAKNLILFDRAQDAVQAVENARHTAYIVRKHLSEPSHVPTDSFACIHNKLVELESLIARVEVRLQP